MYVCTEYVYTYIHPDTSSHIHHTALLHVPIPCLIQIEVSFITLLSSRAAQVGQEPTNLRLTTWYLWSTNKTTN